MTMIMIDGAEAQAKKKGWSGGAVTYSAGRFGGSAYRPLSGLGYTFPAETTIVIGFAYLWSAGDTGAIIFFSGPGDPSSVQITVKCDGVGGYTVRRGSSSGTVLSTSPANVLVAGSYVYFEIKVKIHDTTGVVDTRINGVSATTFSGDTCNSGAETTVSHFEWATTPPSTTKVDDLYLLSTAGSAPYNDFLGDVKIESLFPNNNGNSSQLVGSDGNSVNNYQQVDEVPAAVADYNGSATVGNKDTYALTDLVTSSGTVLAVQTSALCFKSDAGAANMKTVERLSGGTERDSASQALVATPGAWIDNGVQVLDPAAAAWTIASVNAMEAGVKVG